MGENTFFLVRNFFLVVRACTRACKHARTHARVHAHKLHFKIGLRNGSFNIIILNNILNAINFLNRKNWIKELLI